MTIYRNFEDDVKTGEKAEQLIAEKFKQVFAPVLQRIMYNPIDQQSVKLQKSGVDGIVSFKPVNYDVKCRDNKYYLSKYYKNYCKTNCIYLETVSVAEHNTPGWFYTSHNIIVYVWWNKTKTRFVDGYILDIVQIRDWITGKENSFIKVDSASKSEDRRWNTIGILVPIEKFPLGTILQINKSIFREDEQAILNEWFGASDADDSHV